MFYKFNTENDTRFANDFLVEKDMSDADDYDLEFLVQDMAEQYHSNNDGWEDKWPVTFWVWDETGKPLGAFTVEREFEPVFCATKKKEPVQQQTTAPCRFAGSTKTVPVVRVRIRR